MPVQVTTHVWLLENWMECVDSEKEKGNDFVETCMNQVRRLFSDPFGVMHGSTQIQDLRQCMLANPEYYRPMLEEEEHYLEEKESESEAITSEERQTAA